LLRHGFSCLLLSVQSFRQFTSHNVGIPIAGHDCRRPPRLLVVQSLVVIFDCLRRLNVALGGRSFLSKVLIKYSLLIMVNRFGRDLGWQHSLHPMLVLCAPLRFVHLMGRPHSFIALQARIIFNLGKST